MADSGYNWNLNVALAMPGKDSEDNLQIAHRLIGLAAARGYYPVGSAIRSSIQAKMDQAGAALRAHQLVDGGWGQIWNAAGSGSNSVSEISEGNNVAVSAVPIAVSASYTATVTASPEVALAGTPITLNGTAHRAGSGRPGTRGWTCSARAQRWSPSTP